MGLRKRCLELPELSLRIDGEGAQTLFFLHGWPDDSSLWDKMVKEYSAKGFRCVRVTMPHFNARDWALLGKWSTFGYGFDSVAELLRSALIRSRREGENSDPPPVLILHDWGSVWGFWCVAKHPELARAVVAESGRQAERSC